MIDKVIARLKANEEKSLDELKELLRLPSVSADKTCADGIRAAAEWLAKKMEKAGLKTEIAATAGNPVVYGERLDNPGGPTILVYGHYDVQPPDPLDLWESEPFEPVVKNGKLVARGASDDKGQLFTHILAVEAWIAEAGKLPVNVKVILEGEEEVSSVNLPKYLEENREKLACDVVVVSDTSQFGPDMPAITYGLKGLTYHEIGVEGPSMDLHSGSFGGTIANPVNVLAQMLAKMHDEKGRVQIPGFYDDVLELADWEKKEFADIPFDEEDYRKKTGSPALFGEEGYTTLERRWARPTFDVNGIWGGYQAEGAKTIIPSKAGAKVSMRLVPNQDPEKIGRLFGDHVRKIAPAGVKVEVVDMSGGKPLLLDTNTPFFEKATAAVEKAFGRRPFFIREGGSIPITQTFKEVLGADTLLLGWGQDDDKIHSPNEQFDIGDFHRGTRGSAYLIGMLGD